MFGDSRQSIPRKENLEACLGILWFAFGRSISTESLPLSVDRPDRFFLQSGHSLNKKRQLLTSVDNSYFFDGRINCTFTTLI